jgi:hypothetical protein
MPQGCCISWIDPQDGNWHQQRLDGTFVTAAATTGRNPRADRDGVFADADEDRHNMAAIYPELGEPSAALTARWAPAQTSPCSRLDSSYSRGPVVSATLAPGSRRPVSPRPASGVVSAHRDSQQESRKPVKLRVHRDLVLYLSMGFH